MSNTENWKTPLGGEWTDGANWVDGSGQTGSAPTLGQYVTFVNGSYGVFIDKPAAGGIVSLGSGNAVTDASFLVTVHDLAVLQVQEMDIYAGTFDLAPTGVLTGNAGWDSGYIDVFYGGTMQFDGGALDGVKWVGTLDLSPQNSIVTIRNGITLVSTGIYASGDYHYHQNFTINLTGDSSVLRIAQDDGTHSATLQGTTLSYGHYGATLDLGSQSSTDAATLEIVSDGATGTTLTLASDFTIDAVNGGYARIADDGVKGDTLVNNGTMNAGYSSDLKISVDLFVNNAAINVTGADTLRLQPRTSFDNAMAGVLTIADYSTVYFGDGTGSATFSNEGQISASDGARLYFYGNNSVSGVNYTGNGVLDVHDAQIVLTPLSHEVLGSGFATEFFDRFTGKNDTFVIQVGQGAAVTLAVPLDANGAPVTTTVAADSSFELAAAFAGEIDFAGTVDSNGVAHDAVLKLDDPAYFTGTLVGLEHQAVLDFGAATVDAATIDANAGTISITVAGTTYQYSASTAAGDTLRIQDNGHQVALASTVTPPLELSWIAGGADDWFDPDNWAGSADPAHPAAPTSGDNVTIDAAGAYTVRIDNNAAANNLTLNASGATLTIQDSGSRIVLGGTLRLQSGTLDFASDDSQIVGGTISAEGGRLVSQGGALIGVTYQGALDLSSDANYLYVFNGITLEGAGGIGPGDVELTGKGAALLVYTDATLDNANILLGSDANAGGASIWSGGKLDFGSNLDIEARETAYISGDALTNRGAISGDPSLTKLEFDFSAGRQAQPSFDNYGQISVTTGDLIFNINTNSVFTNQAGGAISINNASAEFGVSNAYTLSFVNNGALTATNSLLIFRAATTPTGINYSGSGTIDIRDSSIMLDLAGNTNLGANFFAGFADQLANKNDSLEIYVEANSLVTLGESLTPDVSNPTAVIEGGTLELAGAYSGSIDFADSLYSIGASLPSILKLDDPASFTGTLANFDQQGVLDFGAATVDSATIDAGGGAFAISVGGATYHYSALLPAGYTLNIQDNGHQVVAAPPPAVLFTSFAATSSTVATFTATGTAGANGTVYLYQDESQLGSTIADASGAWTFTTASALPPGSSNLTARTFAAGGQLESISQTIEFSVTPAGSFINSNGSESPLHLSGAAGNDMISGTDETADGLTMTGGPGADIFVYSGGPFEQVITDFGPTDRLELFLGFAGPVGYEVAQGYVQLRQDGADTVMDYDPNGGGDNFQPAVRLLGVNASDLSFAQFGVLSYASRWTNGAGTSNWNDAGNWSDGVVPGAAYTGAVTVTSVGAPNLRIGAGNPAFSVASLTLTTTTSSIVTLDVSGSLTVNGALASHGATVSIEAGGVLNVAGDFDQSGTLNNSGSLVVGGTYTEGDATLLGNGGTLAAGSVSIVSGGQFTFDGGTLDTQNFALTGGTVTVQSGVVNLALAPTDYGAVEIAGGATLDLSGDVGSGVTLDFTGSGGRLVIEDPARFSAAIHGIEHASVIEIAGRTIASAAISGTELTITTSDGGLYRFQVDAQAPQGNFTPSQDGGVVICFMAGTFIATPTGQREVQDLAKGDLVITHDGRLASIRWLGRQTVSTRFSDPLRVLPIRIRAGALGDERPARDLLVSPDHALLVNDLLIHASALVNGTSIFREKAVPETYVYYHVELDDHALILAENIPAETFVDHVDRMNFDNWDEHEALYPDGRAIVEMPYPRAKARRQVPKQIRTELDERAKALCVEEACAAA
jgi:hypothetical protein